VVVNDHAPALTRLRSVVSPIAVADPAAARRKAVLKMLDLPAGAGFVSHSSLLEAHRPDYVLVAVPPGHRREIIADCARRGIHVLLEKPIATRPADASLFQQLMENAGLKFGLVHNYLFYPEYRQIQELVRDGAIGPVRHITLNFLGVPDSPGARAYRPLWRHDPGEAGGGVLMDMIHAVYLAEHLMEGEVEAVGAVVDNLGYPEGEVEDLALLHLHFPQGYVTINMAWGHGPGGVEVSGARGRILVFYQDYGTGPFSDIDHFLLINEKGKQAFYPRVGFEKNNNFLKIHENFVSAIRQDQQPLAPASVGKRNLETALAAYVSALEGRVIRIPFASDHPVYLEGVQGLRKLSYGEENSLVRRGLFGL
jgi:predicted dehydrogenase